LAEEVDHLDGGGGRLGALVALGPTGAGEGVAPLRLLAGLLAACALVAVIAWLGTDLL